MEGLNIYTNLYLISGFLFPSLILIISNTNFSSYQFNNKSPKFKSIKNLSFLVLSNLLFLAYLLSNYIVIFFDLLFKLINNFNFNLGIESFPYNLIYIIVIGLLLINKSKVLIKKSILFIFLFISITIWLTTINQLDLEYNYFYNHIIFKNFFEIKNLNILNTLNLLLIEICFYFWSYISYKNNLSDWKVLFPHKQDLNPLLNILLFYACTIFYYSR